MLHIWEGIRFLLRCVIPVFGEKKVWVIEIHLNHYKALALELFFMSHSTEELSWSGATLWTFSYSLRQGRSGDRDPGRVFETLEIRELQVSIFQWLAGTNLSWTKPPFSLCSFHYCNACFAFWLFFLNILPINQTSSVPINQPHQISVSSLLSMLSFGKFCKFSFCKSAGTHETVDWNQLDFDFWWNKQKQDLTCNI